MLKTTLLTSILLCSSVLLADMEEAKELFNDAACMDCHNNEDFHVQNRKSKNFKELHKAVDGCRFANNVEWFDDESMHVTRYLNAKHYKFVAPELEE